MNIRDCYPAEYERLLADKVLKVKEQFAALDTPEIQVFRSPKEHYRMRAEFVIFHEGDECHYVMFDDPEAEQEEDAGEQEAAAEEAPCEGQEAEAEDEPASKRAKTEAEARAEDEAPGEVKLEAESEVNTLSKPTTRKDRKAAKRKAKADRKAQGKGKGPAAPRKVRVKITSLPRAHENINKLMPQVLQEVQKSEILKRKLFQVNFITTLAGDTLLTLLYHKKLDEEWQEAAVSLKATLGVNTLLGRAKKQVIALDRNHVVEELSVNGKLIKQKQIEGSFTQPNAVICQHMLEWSLDVTSANPDTKDKDLLELYCGNGNFSLALAPNFRRILGTEISKVSVEAAQWNIQQNGTDNVQIAAMSSEDFTATLKEGKSSTKLGDTDLTTFDFTTVLVDPPRAGMDDATCKMVQDYDNIVYISCNPDTLRENLETICLTHRVERFAVFDQFPYTAHLECGAYLVRKK